MPRQIHSESNSTIPSFCLKWFLWQSGCFQPGNVLYQGEVSIAASVWWANPWGCWCSLSRVSPGCHRAGHTDGHPRALPVSSGSAEPRAPLPKQLSLLEQHLGFQQRPWLTLEELLPLPSPGGLRGQGVQGGTPEHGQGTRPPLPSASWGIKPESSNQRAKACIPTCTLTSSYIFIWLCST